MGQLQILLTDQWQWLKELEHSKVSLGHQELDRPEKKVMGFLKSQSWLFKLREYTCPILALDWLHLAFQC